MPRRKRKSIHATEINNKRWKESQSDVISDSSSESRCKNTSMSSNICARLQKLQSCDQIETDNTHGEYIFVNTAELCNLFSNVKCGDCGNRSLKLDCSSAVGFYRNLKLVCSECTNVFSGTKRKQECSNLNIQVASAFSNIGKGYTGIEKFCMTMNMAPFSSRTYMRCVEKLNSATCILSENMFEQVHKEVKEAYGSVSKTSPTCDIGVSFDGTWLTRGHSSLIGVSCIIDILTGYVIDFEVMSKICSSCKRTQNVLGKDSVEFHIWYEGHEQFCEMNHFGSSSSMEMEAAATMWRRSLNYGLRYTTILSDGDAKTFNYLCENKIYGPSVEIKKEECVNHVSKRLGTALRNAVKDWRVRGVNLGGKGHGNLKETTIKKLTKYYQRAILQNKGNVNDMKTAIYATLFHSISTDQKPQHHKCPSGADSWCFYQSAVSKGVKPGIHRLNVGTPIKEEFLPKILPIYQRLASNELLEKCISCKTQNANESLHNMIWSRCTKDIFVYKKRVARSVREVICEYNKGVSFTLKGINKILGIKSGCHTERLAKMLDLRKQSFRERRATSKYQHVRKIVKKAKAKRESVEKKREGITYRAGYF